MEQPSDLRSPSEEPPATGRDVLVVEDNEADVFLIEEAIHATGLDLTVHIVKDGEQAVRFFDRADADVNMPSPALVILDINLPKKQGGEVLKYMRASRRCANALVIAVSTSDSQRDREQLAQLGARGYFRKPSNYDEFMKLGNLIQAAMESAQDEPSAPRSL